MKYAHTPSESPPSMHTPPSRAIESLKCISQTTVGRSAGLLEQENGEDSEEEREKRLKELQNQVCVICMSLTICLN